ncbi:aldo/keto reductase [Solirubrobacter phytolaccae]|uniref:Aldo/keto reductase n=1 Tax=Solirubrobacter phytolaccae TaxID=1404360 RepID=A0A9X3N9A6_9ACTN|nr:aldo/keto reductase [Solirubrobacter phytolaccae]MDA0181831.1 aldo/keto reductase [Solirubrobacter phytolaccae]
MTVVPGRLGLGCMGMTWAYGAADRDDAESIRVIHRAAELGVTLLDTADMYGPFTNETLVGKAIAGRRDDYFVATKCGLVVEDAAEYVLAKDGRPEHVREAVDGSLQRLGIDHIDLYQLHRVDPEVPLEETWGAMASLVTEGKVRALGLSEVSVEEIERAHAIHPVASVQSEGSLWTRIAFEAVVPWCVANDAAFLPFAPLGRGFLTGALKPQSFPAGDFRKNNPRFQPEAMDANQALVAKVIEVAERREVTPAQVALAWLLAQGSCVVPIPGTKKVSRLEENAAAASVTLTAEDLAELDELPEAVGSRY